MKRPLSVVLATIEYPPQTFSSGIGSYTKAIAEGLSARGHRVHVLSRGTQGNNIEQHGNLTVEFVVPARAALPGNVTKTPSMIALGMRGLVGEVRYRRRLARRIHELVADDGFELVEAADHLGEAAWYDPARHPHVPFVVRLHTPMTYSEEIERNVPSWVTAVVSSQERRQVSHATHLSSPSSALVPAFLKSLHAVGRPVHVCPNPKLSGVGSPAPVTEQGGPPVVLFVGRLTNWKGVDTLVRAVPQVLSHYPQTRFQLVGSDSSTSTGASYRDYVQSLLPASARDSVEFVGKVPPCELEAYYAQATVCVFPSRFDVQPYTCFEAMTYGKAIIGSTPSGMREMLEDGAAGLLHDPPDVDDLTRKLLALLGDPELRRRLGSRAFARVNSVYSTDRVLDATEEFYTRAIDELHGRRRNRARVPARPHATGRLDTNGSHLAD